MPDLEILRKHLYQLNIALDNLQKHQNCKMDILKNNLDVIWILERGLCIVIQHLLYLFSHIVSSDFNRQCETYTEVAGLLGANNVISSDEEELLHYIIRFRNLLSYEYLSTSQEELVDIVRNKLDDIVRLRSAVVRYCGL